LSPYLQSICKASAKHLQSICKASAKHLQSICKAGGGDKDWEWLLFRVKFTGGSVVDLQSLKI
jgi:hypothetical protein